MTVPYDTGNLKDLSVTIETKKIIFNAKYAKVQYLNNKGMGKQGTSLGGLRGAKWDKRMWVQRGDEIVQSVAKFCGGRSKK